jgi:outer membrane protein OmpA-like peptidoglycan-associated protein
MDSITVMLLVVGLLDIGVINSRIWPAVLASRHNAVTFVMPQPPRLLIDVNQPIQAKATITTTKKVSIYFKTGTSYLRSESKRLLQGITDNDLCGKDQPVIQHVTISGHTDRTGPDEYNQKLSLDRAWTVTHYLTQNGLPMALVHMQAYGSQDSSPEKEMLDRRVDVEITCRSGQS